MYTVFPFPNNFPAENSSSQRTFYNYLKNLQLYVPESVHRFTFGLNEYTVYKAKDSNRKNWNNSVLKNLVIENRKSYKRYYNINLPELDEDDSKSSVYLTHVTFPVTINNAETIIAEKWYSLRFVFPDKNPSVHAIDLDGYILQKQQKQFSIIYSIRNTLPEFQNLSTEETKKRIVILSRFCSIPVYTQSKKYEDIFITHDQLVRKNSHGGISFALMNSLFLTEIQNRKPKIELLTTQMHMSLSHTILSYPPYSLKNILPLQLAYKTLHVKPSQIRLDRFTYGEYIYSYPGYFLNIYDLTNALAELVSLEKLSIKTIERYLDNGLDFTTIKDHPKMFHFRNLGNLFTVKGRIPNESITGEQLREFLNHKVDDGPRLRLVKTNDWKKGVENYLPI